MTDTGKLQRECLNQGGQFTHYNVHQNCSYSGDGGSETCLVHDEWRVPHCAGATCDIGNATEIKAWFLQYTSTSAVMLNAPSPSPLYRCNVSISTNDFAPSFNLAQHFSASQRQYHHRYPWMSLYDWITMGIFVLLVLLWNG
jgi:hypothetical protein